MKLKSILRNKLFSIFLLLNILVSCTNEGQVSEEEWVRNPKVLVFSKVNGYKHASIPAGFDAIRKMGMGNNFRVDTTTNADVFTDKNLRNYRAVIFNNTNGNILSPEHKAAFERYIQSGGGFVGIHSAAATEYEWPWYGKLVGAFFDNHPVNPGTRKATVEVVDTLHISTIGLPKRWERNDEWYNYRSFYPEIKVLINLDENTYEGGNHGSKHPIAWFHEFDGGRAFYTGGGHESDNFSEPEFLQHLLGGVKYAMGDGKMLDYSKAYSKVVPEENRFVKTVLVNGLNSPMTLEISDDGKIFYTELRTANLFMFDTKTGKNIIVHRFNVSTKGGTGLIGVTLDPGFSKNRWLYCYYAPPKAEEPIIFNLSRFYVNEDYTLDLVSEKILLQVPVQENSGSHHGGDFAWDKDGNLYLSTGDSTTPFPSDGYAPLDERQEKIHYSMDAQRSSANTNDFKGKILKIKPQPDGTYTIPEGNLFPVGTENALPEIYVMGCRNPYRIAVNPLTSVVYWGEIGPDAGKDSIQGPKGYDEFNQAKKAGNFGWPYFVGDNQAYTKWDFTTKTAGSKYDPARPINESPNNTGLRELPPAMPALIWYPYEASKEFPELGLGGRSAMVGQFYSFNKELKNPKKFPEYYNNTLFIFDWMRNWVMSLRFDEKEDLIKIEPFMSDNGDFRRPIDMVFGKDGIMYMLEYGTIYGADNEDARLVKIEYNTGNRAPIAKAGAVDKQAKALANSRAQLTSENKVQPLKLVVGKAPLTVDFTSEGSKDLDYGDVVNFHWNFDGKATSSEANPSFTFNNPGTYQVILKATDIKGAINRDTLTVKVGNARPVVQIETADNKSFFWDDLPFKYAVKVSDDEDALIDESRIKVLFNYNPTLPTTISENAVGHQDEKIMDVVHRGSTLITNSDCKACHTIDKLSVGPSYVEVAKRYKVQSGSVSFLAEKIINGGGGSWGTTYVMSAHPQISKQDAEEMVKYIFSLTDKKEEKTSLAAKGALKFDKHNNEQPNGKYTFYASYIDNGANGIEGLLGSEFLIFRNAKIRAAFADKLGNISRWGNWLGGAHNNSFIMLKNVDLSGISKFAFEFSSNKGGEIEIRINSQYGPVIGKNNFGKTDGDKRERAVVKLQEPVYGFHDVYFRFVKKDLPNNDIINVQHIFVEK
jgi:cytochrome c